MKKILLTIFIFSIAITTYCQVKAADMFDNSSIIISGYADYAPLGHLDKNNNFHTIFSPVIQIIAQQTKQNPIIKTYNISATEAIEKDIRIGKTDIFLGAYNQSDHFENLDMMFPAVAQNPITFFMLPVRAHLVQSFDDLKKLKGIRYSKELYSDFVEEKIKDYNVEISDSTYEMFEKLFTQKVDYIISGYYFGMIEAIKLGVSHKIAVSKQPLWNIPLFIGIVKISPRHDMLVRGISRHIQDEEFIALIKDNLKKSLELFEQKYSGVVPPTFGLENSQDSFEKSTPVTQITSENNEISSIKNNNSEQ